MAFTPADIEQFAAEYAAEAGCTIEEARPKVQDIADRMAAQQAAATPTGEVFRTKVCPDCRTRQYTQVDVDWTTRVGRKVDVTWCCEECGASIADGISLRTGETQPIEE